MVSINKFHGALLCRNNTSLTKLLFCSKFRKAEKFSSLFPLTFCFSGKHFCKLTYIDGHHIGGKRSQMMNPLFVRGYKYIWGERSAALYHIRAASKKQGWIKWHNGFWWRIIHGDMHLFHYWMSIKCRHLHTQNHIDENIEQNSSLIVILIFKTQHFIFPF